MRQTPPNTTTVPPEVLESNFLATDASCEASAQSLSGEWQGTCTSFRAGGDWDENIPYSRQLHVEDDGKSFSQRDGCSQYPDTAVEGTVGDADRVMALRTPDGLEHQVFLGGGVYVRVSVSLRVKSTFVVEQGWLVAPDTLIRNRIEYEDAAWSRSVFAREVRTSASA
jgi:hypothetical protein